MSYSLMFCSSFFYADGEPYDRDDLALNAEGNPTSVYSAICLSLRDASWKKDIVHSLLGDACLSLAEDLVAQALMDMVRRTDTCSNLSSPVRVWIDKSMDFTVEVYDADK